MICGRIQRLINYAIKYNLITGDDELVVRNLLMDALGVADWSDAPLPDADAPIDDILAPLVGYACQTGVIEDTSANRDLFGTKLMGILTPMPREIIREFRTRYAVSPEAATDWYYDNSQKLNYVRAGRIAKDLKWTYDSAYGRLDITINRSKPEKDPRDIAKAGATASVAYPKCQLCAENMGYAGRRGHPARQNLRPIPIEIDGGAWYLQYSPYGYYNEHCIVFNRAHIPMVIDAAVFRKLFDFIGLFPHYFVGSNADLPIVGGSILSHEHFQGGRYTFAMATAAEETEFNLPGYSDVHAATVKWPMSVIRLSSADRSKLAEACAAVLAKWRGYTDEAANILAFTEGVPHNTITPIARRRNGLFECDLVLRNNLTSADRPLGVYHPNPSLHHIKKENIGLIEVMGLAVLPARLDRELGRMEELLTDGKPLEDDPELEKHAQWASAFADELRGADRETVRKRLEQEVGRVFLGVLEDAGVYKNTPEGRAALRRFTEKL